MTKHSIYFILVILVLYAGLVKSQTISKKQLYPDTSKTNISMMSDGKINQKIYKGYYFSKKTNTLVALSLLPYNAENSIKGTFDPKKENSILSFRIPFIKNKTEFNKEDVLSILQGLNEPDFIIDGAYIYAYSSIDGDSLTNAKLQYKRAESILSVLQTLQTAGFSSHITLDDSWGLFLLENEDGKYADLVAKGKHNAIKQINSDKKLRAELESVLEKECFANIVMDVTYDLSGLKEEKYLKWSFQKALTDNNIGKALKILQYLHKAVSEKKYDASVYDALEIPEDLESVALLNNKLYYKYLSENVINDSVKYNFEKLQKLEPTNAILQYNKLFCEIKLLINSNDTAYLNKVQQSINNLYGKIDSSIVNALNLDWQLKILDDIVPSKKTNYLIDRCITNIKNICQIKDATWQKVSGSAYIFNTKTLTNNGPSQTIRGTISDKQSQSTIPGANIIIIGTNPLKGTSSDMDGKFKISDVAPGRYDLKIMYLGYKEIVMPNVQVTSGKEIVLDIGMEENINSLNEVEVSGTKKNETNNEMVSVSGRSFSMEEVNRYAGGRSDPSRLAANFAGVSSPDDSRNDIVIRGNSPMGVLWRIEGLNVPNPNHFSTIGTTGGPVSAINTNMIKNSDFFTSAFPAEYGNANAGVFDLGFRTGNSEKREHTFQLGALTGIEAMTEGPIKKEKGSSYLLAYRYSFVGVAQAIGIPVGTTATPFYQDISFKINGGNTKLGKFTLFGLGAKSHISFLHNKIDATDLFADPTKDSYFTSDVSLIGLKHFIKLNEKSYFNTVCGATYNASNFLQDRITNTSPLTTLREIENKTSQIHYLINTSFNSKVNSRLFFKIGVVSEAIQLMLNARTLDNNNVWNQYWDSKDNTNLLQGYAQAKYRFNDDFTVNMGIHSQFLTLNNSQSIEPRLGLKYQLGEKSTISLGYGMHSQMQPADVYFYKSQNSDGSYSQTNKNIGFTKSQHFVLGYDLLPFKDWRLKAEAYYQLLSNVPVTQLSSSFSMLNAGSSFVPNNQINLVNSGTGTNYGAELTIEKFFSQGYYVLLTGTIYESKYKGSDGVERNTAFNGKFVYNVLGGKDFKIGKQKGNVFSVGLKMTQAGGRFYTPVDLAASQVIHEQVLLGDDYAFSQRNPNFFRLDVKTGLTLNSHKSKLAQTFSFDVQNVTNNKNVFAQRYNPTTNLVNTAYQIGFFPNFIYKIQF